MFLQFDDGQNALIARGGPTGSVAGVPDHLTRVTARVDQADLSPDSGKGYRTLAKTFIPGVTADEAAAGARQHAQGARLGGNAYGADRNSNSYAEDAGEPIFKRRVGDSLTWGY